MCYPFNCSNVKKRTRVLFLNEFKEKLRRLNKKKIVCVKKTFMSTCSASRVVFGYCLWVLDFFVVIYGKDFLQLMYNFAISLPT